MTDNSDILPDLAHEDAFDIQRHGYNRRQVDEFIARTRDQIRGLEQRQARSLAETEQLRRDLAAARQHALGAKPVHEEVSGRIAQILKLAEDEAESQKATTNQEIARQRSAAQAYVERISSEARGQAERILTAAQEEAERAITSARAEADKTFSQGRAEAERMTTEARKKAENVLAAAQAQAKKALDEATARATAIHDGAERRLNLLSTEHAETIKRLSEILDSVSALVTAETVRMSLQEEVDQASAQAIGSSGSAPSPAHPASVTPPSPQAVPRPSQPPPTDKQAQPRPPLTDAGEQTEGIRILRGNGD